MDLTKLRSMIAGVIAVYKYDDQNYLVISRAPKNSIAGGIYLVDKNYKSSRTLNPNEDYEKFEEAFNHQLYKAN